MALALGLSIHIGCQKPIPPTEPTAGALAPDEDLDAIWDASLSVLNKFDMRPDRQDRALGIITTFPTTSAQWFEPWRQDVASGRDLLESSIATHQRKATVRFVRNDAWTIEIQVDVYRLSRQETQITTASSMLHGFAGLIPTETGYREGSIGAMRPNWVHLGRDGAMERRLLRRILSAVGASYIDSVETAMVEPS